MNKEFDEFFFNSQILYILCKLSFEGTLFHRIDVIEQEIFYTNI